MQNLIKLQVIVILLRFSQILAGPVMTSDVGQLTSATNRYNQQIQNW
jgi:hypothetical protein